MLRGSAIGIAFLCASASALAQTGTITGTVMTVDGARPLADVQVYVLGTTIGTITRDDGSYSLTAPQGIYTLHARRIGFALDSASGVVVTAGATTTVDFRLRASVAVLERMVVTGYGRQEAKDRTGVVETVSAEEFNTGRVISPEQLIQAKVAGVQVIDDAEPGAGISLRIRGGTSVTSSNEPLIVVDGIPLSIGGGISAGRNPLAFLNPNDIESITVLKDASATAIYGSRGANGVVMVTTKSGVLGGPAVSYTTSMSTSSIVKQPDLLNAAQFRQAVTDQAPGNLAIIGTSSTDWRGLVERSGTGREHQVAVAGNGPDMHYRFSLGYLDQQGVILNSGLERISGSLNYTHRLFDNRLAVRTSLFGTRTADTFTPIAVIGSANAMAPTQPVIDPATGDYFQWANPLGPNNPIQELRLISDEGETYRSIGKLEGELRLPFLEELQVTSRVGYDVTKAERTTFAPASVQQQQEGSLGTLYRNLPEQLNTLFDLFGTYRRELARFGGSDLEATAGYSFEESRGDFPSFQAQGLSFDLLGPYGIPASTARQTNLSVDESRLASFFGRVNYYIRDRYLFTASVRRDGSSKFGPEERWGTFPSLAFAWRASEEDFMPDFGALSDLKLRLSWGVNGNQAFGNYQAFSSYAIGTNTAQYQFGNEFVTTIRPSAADPGIKWEETTSYNVGLDWGLFSYRLTGALDYYVKKTEDLIFTVPVAAGTNLSNFVTTNIGNMENRGFEFSVNAALLDGSQGGLIWNASLNAATNHNELSQINAVGTGDDRILTGGILGGVGSLIQVLQPGQPVNSFFVYKHRRGPDGRPIYEDTNGDLVINDQDLYVDINGDNTINQSDRRPYKSPAPKWIIGHTSNLSWNNVDVGFTIRAHFGNYVYNNVASNQGHYSALTGSAPTNLHASVLRNQFVSPQYLSDVYVEDASFIRMDNFTVGYTFRNVRALRDLRLFGVVQNVFTMTDYTGVDPMAGVNGIDANLYPRSRTLTAGISMGF